MEDTLQKPVQAEFPQTTVQQEKKKKSVLFYVNILLLMLIVGLGAYILYKEGYWAKQQEQEMEETEEAGKDNKGDGSIIVEVKETTFEDYNGEFVKAKLPQGWSIKEYKDGDGTEFAGEGYKGLSALNIYKDGNEMLSFQTFELGSDTPYGEIYRFKDYSIEEERERIARLKEMGVEAKVVDYTNTTYVEYSILGNSVRRIDLRFFQDTVRDNETFESSNIPNRILISIEKDGASSFLGYYKFNEKVQKDELITIDEILKSLQPA